jgi:hypothetical protein
MTDDAFNAVDDYLAEHHRIGLEEVLCYGCYTGRLPVILADVAKLAVRPLYRHVDEGDRGMALSYEGVLTVNGLAYRFRCSIFGDRGGERFLSDVADFAPVTESSARPGRFVRN